MIEQFLGAQKTIDGCTSCTACMAACPMMKAVPEYRGPKFIAVSHGRLHFSQDDVEKSLEYCSNCKSCDRACPNGVSVSTLNMLQRAKFKHSPRDKILAHVEDAAKKVRAIPFGTHAMKFSSSIGKILGISEKIGVTSKRNLPLYAKKSFYKIFPQIKQKKSSKQVVFFPGCYIKENEPDIGLYFVRVMNANGFEVLIDDKFKCCGSPLIAYGFLDEARSNAENNLSRILYWQSKKIPVVSACTSCSLMLKIETAEIFNDDRFKTENVFDAFEFLESIEFNSNLSSVPKKILYHVPCHLKSLEIGLPAKNILKSIPDLKLELANAGCCGMSGSHGFKKELYDVSMKIGSELFEKILSTNPDEVICECGPCRMQIKQGTNRDSIHPLQILAQAYI